MLTQVPTAIRQGERTVVLPLVLPLARGFGLQGPALSPGS